MKSEDKITFWSLGVRRLLSGVFGAMAAVLSCWPAAGVDENYINNAIVSYPGTAEYPPVIDALNFINNASFTVNFTELTFLDEQPFYETSDTLNYTNNGLMMVNSGFQFDTQSSVSGMRTPATCFYNPGTIYCASTNDTSDPFGGELADLGYAQCWVSATNIVNPGEIDTGYYGLIQLAGDNVNLYQGWLNIEPVFSAIGSGVSFSGTGYFGTNIWLAGYDLSANSAISGYFPIPPNELVLNNSTAYTNLDVVGSNNIVRCVFIQDSSGSNVNANVYFLPATLDPFNAEYVLIQWAGTYVNPATGQTNHTYLYLEDNYVLGASTNVAPVVGVPGNFYGGASATPLINSGFATPSYLVDTIPYEEVTNLYDVGNIDVGLSATTNEIPNLAVTNLPGRVQIYGNHDLDLRRARITGPNYLSLWSTNQFHGADGALIQSPYSDIHLGVTNGLLTVSNVMQAHIPIWGGNIVAWNTRWLQQDPTTGLTNDYRVLIVSDQLTPTFSAEQQDLVLHGTNTVISDTFNILRTLDCDAESLTLTTNVVGNGANSFDGELNLETANIFWQSSVPNLRYLTNNGAIRTGNLFYYSYPSLTNSSSALASGTLSETGTNAVKGDKVTVGTNQYVFVAALTNTVANQVAILRSSFDGTMSNLIAAINGGGAGGPGVSFSASTAANPQAVAGNLVNHAFTVTAIAPGANGNAVATTFTPATSAANLSWGASDLVGGVITNVVSFLTNSAFINNGLLLDQGAIIYAGNFENGGAISNGTGGFALQSLTTTLTNGLLAAGADVSITADSLLTSNLTLVAGRSLTLTVTNELTDTGVTNHNVWAVGSASLGSGFNLPVKPAQGDLLGTTVTLSAPENRTVSSVWAGEDRGPSPAGYTNNAAIGRMIFDVAPSGNASQNGVLAFRGPNPTNAYALYVDLLVLTNFATNGNAINNYDFPWLQISTNMNIYFGQAIENGRSVAEVINDQTNANSGRLHWVSSYAGYYSSTNLYYTNTDGSIITNTVNTALAQSVHIDSDADGIPNLNDPTPFFEPAEIHLRAALTNLPAPMVRVQWTTIPNATNYVYYSTVTNLADLTATNWLPFASGTNWYFGNSAPWTTAPLSPQIYIDNPNLGDNSQQTNVWLYDAVTNAPRYYRVVVWPALDFAP